MRDTCTCAALRPLRECKCEKLYPSAFILRPLQVAAGRRAVDRQEAPRLLEDVAFLALRPSPAELDAVHKLPVLRAGGGDFVVLAAQLEVRLRRARAAGRR